MSSTPVIRPVRKSLITLGLQASTTRSSSSDPEANPQSSNPEIMQIAELSTSSSICSAQPCSIKSPLPLLEVPSRGLIRFISSIEDSSDGSSTSEEFLLFNVPAPLQYLPPNSSMFAGECGRMTMRERQRLGQFDSPQQQHNLPFNPSVLVKGFGNFNLDKAIKSLTKMAPRFPPLSNTAYEYLNYSDHTDRSKPASFTPQLDGATFVKDYLWKNWEEEQRIGSCGRDKGLPSPGELLARKMDWTHKTYDPEEGPSAYPPPIIRYFKPDFIKDVDKAVQLGRVPYEMCNKCGERHIPWGPTVTMQERDTCLSLLPEWFPTYMFEQPWEAFMKLLNDVVRYSEREQGLALNPDRKTWDKEWHEATPQWRAVGRYGGWWKCRSGLEDGQERVPSPEKNCKVCHREKTEEEIALDQRIEDDEDQKLALHMFIKKFMRIQMEKDKAFVKARMQITGG